MATRAEGTERIGYPFPMILELGPADLRILRFIRACESIGMSIREASNALEALQEIAVRQIAVQPVEALQELSSR